MIEARFKATPQDFRVDEVLGFEPSGGGEHAYLHIEKTGWNSNDVSSHIAERLDIRKRLISHCGVKDRDAVTRQWFSVHLPGQPSPDPESLETEGIRILEITRGTRKLRRGSHDGNRFEVTLRDVALHKSASRANVEARWQAIASGGVPNYFGPQRFGKSGDNPEQARRLFRGETEIRDRLVRGLIISSARSLLFNAVVAKRIADGLWGRIMDGDVFGFPDNRSLILPDRLRGDESERLESGQIELTAPLWGAGELLSTGAAREWESLPADPELAEGLESVGMRQERRVIRLRPVNAEFEWLDQDDPSGSSAIRLRFSLPSGCYATEIVRELASLM